jgi:hypothetical protein
MNARQKTTVGHSFGFLGFMTAFCASSWRFLFAAYLPSFCRMLAAHR